MSDSQPIIIPISTEKDRFAEHLQPENNQRIIFSGQFGSGKTYFLEEFFKEHKEYEAFFLSPVHYSVSRNEDVFEYIKYDILISLFSKETVEWEETHLSNELLLSFFVDDNFIQIAKDTIKHAGKVGKIVSEVIEDIGKYQKKFETFKASSETNQPKEAKTYIDDFQKQIGSIFEYDDNTTLINELLGTIPKEKVLIIDDLDRMDPEHIFRIMNVFAAQFDHERFGYNKFAFDKVIIVCDLDNLRNLFAHKYGSNVDFSGYIDKFYSIKPFMFDNIKALADQTTDLIYQNLTNPLKSHLDRISNIVRLLVKNNIITIRKLKTRKNSSWDYVPIERFDIKRFYQPRSLIFADFLLYLYAYQIEDLCFALDNISEKYHTIDIINDTHKTTILQLLLKPKDFDMYENQPEFHITKSDLVIHFTKKGEYNRSVVTNFEIQEKGKISQIPYFQLLSECIRNYWEIKNDFEEPRY